MGSDVVLQIDNQLRNHSHHERIRFATHDGSTTRRHNASFNTGHGADGDHGEARWLSRRRLRRRQGGDGVRSKYKQRSIGCCLCLASPSHHAARSAARERFSLSGNAGCSGVLFSVNRGQAENRTSNAALSLSRRVVVCAEGEPVGPARRTGGNQEWVVASRSFVHVGRGPAANEYVVSLSRPVVVPAEGEFVGPARRTWLWQPMNTWCRRVPASATRQAFAPPSPAR